MAEDQGVNGDRWTEQACRLFKKAGWQKVADSNIDIVGTDGASNGIDALFHFEDGFYSRMNQAVFIEAKRYATTSFKKGYLSTWVLGLASKIGRLRNSQRFVNTYPIMDKLHTINGVIAVWFHDIENYQNFKEDFIEASIEIKLPIGRTEKNINFRLFVLENERILQLASLLDTIEKFNTESKGTLKFNYPSSARFGNSGKELEVINLEYIFSKFVLARSRVKNSSQVTDIVFYFGDLDMNSFERLRDALLSFEMINNQNDLVIYKYKREDSEFRKIEPDIKELFMAKTITIRDMVLYTDLPPWMNRDE